MGAWHCCMGMQHKMATEHKLLCSVSSVHPMPNPCTSKPHTALPFMPAALKGNVAPDHQLFQLVTCLALLCLQSSFARTLLP